MLRVGLLEKTWERLRAEIKGRNRMRWCYSITNSIDRNLSKLWEMVKDREGWHAAIHGITESWK